MSLDDFDEWDGRFLDEALQAEEAALSARTANATQSHFPYFQQPQQQQELINFSPPRELSQRCFQPSFPDQQTQRLKSELERVLDQLNRLEHECAGLKKDRDKKEEQLRHAFLELDAKDVQLEHLKLTNMGVGVSRQACPQISLQNAAISVDIQVGRRPPTSGTKGTSSTPVAVQGLLKRLSCDTEDTLENSLGTKKAQTDGLCAVSELKRRMFIDNASTTSNGCLAQEGGFFEKSVEYKSSKSIGVQTSFHEDPICFKDKLLPLWGSPVKRGSNTNPFSKLLATCSSDLYVLFRCMAR